MCDSGLDPITRRSLWDVLRKATTGRSVVLTTHSMEEASVLCERVGIMATGRLRCLGTGTRLKNRFGSGFHVSLAFADASNTTLIDQFISKYLPQAKLAEKFGGGRFLYIVPTDGVMKGGRLSGFFAAMTQRETREKYGIIDYGLSESSLEDVFVAVIAQAARDEVNKAGKQLDTNNHVDDPDDIVDPPLTDSEDHSSSN